MGILIVLLENQARLRRSKPVDVLHQKPRKGITREDKTLLLTQTFACTSGRAKKLRADKTLVFSWFHPAKRTTIL